MLLFKRVPIEKTAIGNESPEHFKFLMAPSGDIWAIKTNDNPDVPQDKMTEIHILSAKSNYEHFSYHCDTGLHRITDGSCEFLLAPNGDLYVVKRFHTSSAKTELFVLTASNNYKSFSLKTPTALETTQGNNIFTYLLDPTSLDLFCIDRVNPREDVVAVHVMSKASGYANYSLHEKTSLPTSQDNYDFLLAPNRDIYAFKKNHDINKTEVHILSASSKYKKKVTLCTNNSKIRLFEKTTLHAADNATDNTLTSQLVDAGVTVLACGTIGIVVATTGVGAPMAVAATGGCLMGSLQTRTERLIKTTVGYIRDLNFEARPSDPDFPEPVETPIPTETPPADTLVSCDPEHQTCPERESREIEEGKGGCCVM